MPDQPTHRVRLLIADRRPLAASGLAIVLEDGFDLVVHASCHELSELSNALRSGSAIDAVILDVEMFDADASRAVASVRRLDPSVALLLLTTRIDESLLRALARECVSCVSAFSEGQAIASALRALLTGQTLLPPDVQRALTQTLREPSATPKPSLTSRENQVLELAAAGLTISQIAVRLHISHSTAKAHLLRVYEKLDAPNRSAAVATAVTRGLLHVTTAAA